MNFMRECDGCVLWWLCKRCESVSRLKRERDVYKRALELLIENRVGRVEKLLDEAVKRIDRAVEEAERVRGELGQT